VQALIETPVNGCFGLGYSAGGVALWRADAKGLRLSGLFCVSSTRLREELAITIPNWVFFGETDPKKPSKQWLSQIPDKHTVFKEAGHDYYVDAVSEQQKFTFENLTADMANLVRKRRESF